jgi:deferrochelatase/peroxidase EfeB
MAWSRRRGTSCGTCRSRWPGRRAGRRADNRLAEGRSLTRNAFGFTEGFGNPDGRQTSAADAVALIPSGRGEPEWAVGGSYLALRVIRLAMALWNADSVAEQERIIGRRRDGSWLDGHAPRLVRRSWSYQAGAAEGGRPDEGLLFMAYQGDLETGFLSVQRRLAGQALDRYLLTVGGGYFWVPPADVRSPAWLDALS